MDQSIVITHHELIMDVISRKRQDTAIPLTNISILDIFTHLKTWGYEGKNRLYGKDRFCGLLPLINIVPQTNRIDLLFCISDIEADNQIVRDFVQVNRVRDLTRNNTEGVDTSVHVIIKYNPQTPRNAQFAIEHRAGMGSKIFVDTINYFLRDAVAHHASNFEGNHPTERTPSGQPAKIPFRVKFNYQSIISDEVVRAFETGRVQDVLFHEAISTSNNFDPMGNNYTQKKKTVHLNVGANVVSANSTTIGDKISDIKNSFTNILNSHPSLRGTTFTIKFRNNNGHEQTAYYDSNIQEFSLVKKTYVESELRQPAAIVPVLNATLCDRMFAHI